MGNRDLEATWTYHNQTKHSQASIYSNPHYLDWENQPLPYKVYSTLKPIPLPREGAPLKGSALSAISASSEGSHGSCTPNLETLSRIFFLSAGITKRRTYTGGELYFRAAACTGALYHIELYLVCGNLPGIEAGVYHYGVHDFSVRLLRAGDHRSVLIRASGQEASVGKAPAIAVLTSTYWRNSWKYQARAYRHCFWDSGTILANLLAASAAHDVPSRVALGFVDAEVNSLLGVDSDREVALALVSLGEDEGTPPPSPEVAPLRLETLPLSKSETDYPAIREIHETSSLISAEEAADWHGTISSPKGPPPSGKSLALKPLADAELPQESIFDVILRRGSAREFAKEPITFQQLSTALDRSTRGIPGDFLGSASPCLNSLYLIVNNVEGLAAGTYVFHGKERTLEQLKEGQFRGEAGHLGLGQELPADASVNIYFLSDLKLVLERFGNRGYRAAQLEAAILGGKIYLSAYGQGFGATGLTFFDDAVNAFFSPHAGDKSVMFLIALGRPAKRKSERKTQ